MMKKKLIISLGVFLLLVLVITVLVNKSPQENELAQSVGGGTAELIRDYSPTKGAKSAKVTLVEFLDPACETCRMFFPFVKDLLASHPGKVKLVVRHAPFHHGSDVMVKILEAAKEQGKYWETLEAMLKSQPNWTSNHKAQPEKVWKYLAGTGLDMEKARIDMESQRIAGRVKQDIADTIGLKVQKTPSFFVNGKPLSSFGYQQLRDLVEEEVRKNY
jgi:protein-disulfide isomerase